MTRFIRLFAASLLVLFSSQTYSQTITVRPFSKVIISPFIEATFIQDDRERVEINHSAVDADKLHIESNNATLRLYLDGAKEIPRNPRENKQRGEDLYPAHAVTVTIYYKKLDALSLRGDERFIFPDKFTAEKFSLKLYGGPDVSFSAVRIDDLHATLYGEGSIEMQSGIVNRQTYNCYGEGKVKASAVKGDEARLTAFGESQFDLNVSGRIKITSFGESKLRYRGDAQLVKGINVARVDVTKLD